VARTGCHPWKTLSSAASVPGERKTRRVKTNPHIYQGKESHFGTEYRKTPLPSDRKGPKTSERSSRVPARGEKKSQRDWSTSLKKARAPWSGFRAWCCSCYLSLLFQFLSDFFSPLVLYWTSLTGPFLFAGKRIVTVLITKVALFSLTDVGRGVHCLRKFCCESAAKRAGLLVLMNKGVMMQVCPFGNGRQH